MTDQPRTNRRIKPNLETQFHIDYDWWARDERDLRVYLISHLPVERQADFDSEAEGDVIDWVDPETAEVKRMDGLQMALQSAAASEDFITEQTSLVDAIFRVFIANNNHPLTPLELEDATGRKATMILRTLSGAHVYKGLRPVIE